MNILLLTQFFDPEGTMIGLNFAKAMQMRGHHVEVLTGFPNYPGGKVYPGYRIRFRQTESMDGIKVVRVPLFPSHDRSGLKRMVNYVSFSLSAATIGQFGLSKPDIVFGYNLPTLGLPASLFRFFRGSKIIFSIQDLWPESVTESGMMKSGFLNRILAWQCRRFYRKVDALTVLSPGFRKNLISKGVLEDKVEIVYNWCNEKEMTLVDHSKLRDANQPFTVLFAGNMGKAQALDSVLDAALVLRQQERNIRFRFIGKGVEVERLKQYQEKLHLKNVEFGAAVPLTQVHWEFEKADVLLVHLQDQKLFEITIPSKIQAYLYAGKPILCGVRGDASKMVEDSGAGVCFEPENAKSLAEAVVRMSELPADRLAEMGRKGREYYMSHLCFDMAVDKIDALFRRVVAYNR